MTSNSTSNGQQLELGSIITSAYQSLLSQNLEQTGQALTRVCSKCGVEKPIEAFRISNHNSGWSRSGCYQCERDYARQLAVVRRNAPPLGTVCEVPGCNSTENLCLHHDHNNTAITATLCSTHNHAFGMFNDSLEAMKIFIKWYETLPKKPPNEITN